MCHCEPVRTLVWQSASSKGNLAMNYYVYILSNCTNTTIYTGVTNDLIRRVFEHRQNADPKSFTAKYDVHKLVYFEYTGDVRVALEREKQIKSWSRAKKNKLVTGKIQNGKIYTKPFYNKRNGLPRQCEHWLAMTRSTIVFRLCHSEERSDVGIRSPLTFFVESKNLDCHTCVSTGSQ